MAVSLNHARAKRRGVEDGVQTLTLDHRPERLREWLGGLWHHRSVLVALAGKDFRVRYKRASLGILWSVAVPLFQTAIMVFVFSRVGGFGTGSSYSYAGFVLAGMVPWLYVSTSIPSSTTAIVEGSTLTDKVWFPRAVLALVPAVANLVTLAISVAILVIALPVLGQPVTPRIVLLIPAVALVTVFCAAVGLLLGALYVYFRDLKFVVQAGILAWFYVTPIVYPASALRDAGPWLDFNPLTGIVGLFQHAAVGAAVPSQRALLVSLVTTVVVLVAAIATHRRHDRLFVDLL